MRSKAIGIIVAACMACALIALPGCSSQEEYTPELKDPQVSPPAIGEEGTLRVGVNTSKSPLAGKGSEKIIGIDVDVAAALADQLGLTLSIEDVGTNADRALEEGKVDIVMGQEAVEEDSDIWHSEQYLPTGVVLFAKEGSGAKPPTGAVTPKIAAQISSKSAWAVTNAFGEEALASTNDLASAFSDLSKGNVDFVASDAVIGMYAANLQNTPVEIVCLMDTASGYCVGVKADNKELQDAIKTALETIMNDGVVSVIEDKWLGKAVVLTDVPKVEATPKETDANGAEGEGEEASDAESNAETSNASNTSTANTAASN